MASSKSRVGGTCGAVPSDYVGVEDGCDCPANGDTSCDPDCAQQGNPGGEWCGCEYCYDDWKPEDDPASPSSDDPSSTSDTPFSVQLPDRMTPDEVAILSGRVLRVGARVQVRRGERGFGRMVNAGSEYTSIGPNSHVGETWSACRTEVDEGATIEGPLIAADDVEVSSTGGITGGVEEVPVLPSPRDYTWQPELPDATGQDVSAAETNELPPGGYGDVSVDSDQTLLLSGGVYHLGGPLTVHSGGTLMIDDSNGPVFVYVDDGFVFDGTIVNRDGEFDPELEVLIVVTGTGTVRLGGPFTGSIHAPRAGVFLEHPGEPGYWGTFFGGDVTVSDDVVIHHVPFPWGELIPPREGGGWVDSSIHIEAALDHTTGESTPGEVTLDRPTEFSIPVFVQVRSGNSGTGTAILRLETEDGSIITCRYAGGSDTAHPTTDLSRLAGLQYEFAECDDGTQVGDRKMVTAVSMSVESGDDQHPAGTTSVVLDSGDGCSAFIPPPLQPLEVAQLKQDFAWDRVDALQETDPDGHPALWHGLIYIESKEQLTALDRLRILWSPRPLSATYTEQFRGLCGRVEHATDGQGVVVYAIFPAKFFNLMRTAAHQAIEAGIAPPFRFISPSTPEPEFANSDGSIAYSALASTGFHNWLSDRGNIQPGFWRSISKPFKDAGNWVVDHVIEPLLDGGQTAFSYATGGFDALIDFALPALDDVWESVQEGLGAIAVLLEPTVDLRLRFRLMNLDEAFPKNSYLVRAWGPNCTADPSEDLCGGAGPYIDNGDGTRVSNGTRPILLPSSTQVRVRQWGFTGLLPIMDEDRMDSTGYVHLKAIRNRQARGGDLCVELDSDYAMITTDFIPNEVCDFNRDRYKYFQRNFDETVNVTQNDLYSLAQIKDGYDYNKTVMGHEPHRVDILTGWVANNTTHLLNGSTRAMALCLDFPGVGAGLLSSFLGFGLGDSLLRKDIWWPDDASSRRSRHSRGVITHEYGHFTMCDLLFEVEGASGLTGLIARIFDGEDRDSDIGQMTEAFADTYAMQVAGGTNYITPRGSQWGSVSFCASPPCLDYNYAGKGDYTSVADEGYYDALARYESLIYDVFDRADSSARLTNGVANGDYWDYSSGSFTYATSAYLAQDDEPVSLDGGAWEAWVRRWLRRGSIPNKDNVLGGLFDLAKETHTWCDVCEVAATHSPNAPDALRMLNTTSPRTIALRLDRIDFCAGDAETQSLIGAAPGTAGRMDTSCAVCSDAQLLNRSTGLCEECPAGQAPSSGVCAPCPAGTVSEAGVCRPCASDQIVDGNRCVSCDFGKGPDATQSACVLCNIDTTIDWSSMTDRCDQWSSVPLTPNSGASDNCPDEFWADVINLDQGAYGADLSSVVARPFFDPEINNQTACEASQASIRVYNYRSADEIAIFGVSSGVGVYEACDGLACPPEVCALPAGPTFTSTDLTAADYHLRVFAESNQSGMPVDTSVSVEVTPQTPSTTCGPR